MPFLESVEEARQRVQESSSNDMGNILDPEGEHDNADSEDIGLLEHPEYNVLNPDGLINNESTAVDKAYRQVIQENIEKLIKRTQELDKDQRMVLDIFLKYAKDPNPNLR